MREPQADRKAKLDAGRGDAVFKAGPPSRRCRTAAAPPLHRRRQPLPPSPRSALGTTMVGSLLNAAVLPRTGWVLLCPTR